MAIKWDDSLELGFDEVDSQHRAIFERFEALSEAVQQGQSEEVIEELVTFLFDYAHMHFTAEDKIMVEYKYPKIAVQRHEHGEFSRNASHLKKRIGQDGVTREVAIEVTGNLLRWLIQHIRKHDKVLVEYVKECIALRQKYDN